jgi:DNA-binding HxlR family transcriptional regulator
VPDYGTFCPVSLATDVIADRWTPLVVRELVLGNTRFNDIARCLPGISRSLLIQRLRHLERKGVIELWPSPTGKGNEYHLTPAGKDLEAVLDVMGKWSIEWLFGDLDVTAVDPPTLMWWMHRRMDASRFPVGRTVLAFEHVAPERMIVWLVLDRGEVSVCQQHPGFDTDVTIRATTTAFAEVFQGYRRWSEAVSSGDIELEGPPRLLKALPTWFLWSPWADVTHERASRP